MSNPANSASIPRRDSEGQEVSLLQERLHIPITGIFDTDTEHAVRELQAEHGLKVDGIVGPETAAQIFPDGTRETWMQFREDE